MRRLPPIRGARSGIALLGLAVLGAGCAGPSLVPKEQAMAIERRDRALAQHSGAIHETIRTSGSLGALAFLDARDGRLVVLPGDTPVDAWARYTASGPGGPTGPVSMPPVADFVYRPDIPIPPETVTYRFLQQQQELRTSVAALDAELRTLSDSVAETRKDTQASIEKTREEMRKALDALAEDLTAARTFMLQTAQLAWLDHELVTENATGLRKLGTTSQELTASSAKLAETLQHVSDTLARQLKDLAARLDALRTQVGNVK